VTALESLDTANPCFNYRKIDGQLSAENQIFGLRIRVPAALGTYCTLLGKIGFRKAFLKFLFVIKLSPIMSLKHKRKKEQLSKIFIETILP
jgi:hypothetical protein